MSKFAKYCFLATLTLSSWLAQAANNDPVVLIHGFIGWGRDEMFGVKYWGGGVSGQRDLQEVLKANGTPTYTVAVGPVSSVWDRAVEAFYQVKGGCVDYGAAHAAKHGHERFGRCYAAHYPQWDDTHKVHFVTHSMGGQTARALETLLRDGSQAERDASGTNVAELYKGGKPWTRSITTISTPHDGTTLATGVQLLDIAEEVVAMAAATAGLNSSTNVVYDFKLDQWNLRRNAGESFNSYLNRVKSSSIWSGNIKDISLWDLSPDGAKELNQWTKTYSDTYYFSFSTKSTFRGLLTGFQYPLMTTFLPFQPLAMFMGMYTRNETGKVLIDRSWWENDGIVNTRSMRTPAGHPSNTFSGTPTRGSWNDMGLSNGWDHFDIQGLGCITCNINPLHLAHANRLKALN
jgi:triacylglycerol lipase